MLSIPQFTGGLIEYAIRFSEKYHLTRLQTRNEGSCPAPNPKPNQLHVRLTSKAEARVFDSQLLGISTIRSVNATRLKGITCRPTSVVGLQWLWVVGRSVVPGFSAAAASQFSVPNASQNNIQSCMLTHRSDICYCPPHQRWSPPCQRPDRS